MRNSEMKDKDHLHHALCVRWNIEEYQDLVDTAWRMRIHAAKLVRRFVAEGMAKLQADGGLNKGAEGKADMP